MLFNIYITTTAISYATIIITETLSKRKQKREGITAKQEKSITEIVIEFLTINLNCLLPIHNIIYAISFAIEKNSNQLEENRINKEITNQIKEEEPQFNNEVESKQSIKSNHQENQIISIKNPNKVEQSIILEKDHLSKSLKKSHKLIKKKNHHN